MAIEELTTKMRRNELPMTQKERYQLMVKAHIIDEEGYYHPSFFSKETVAKDRATGNPVRRF